MSPIIEPDVKVVARLSAVALLSLLAFAPAACRFAGGGKPDCDKMRACCAALKGVENGLPEDQSILCEHNPEMDEGCVDTLSDIRKFTPEKNLPSVCR